MNVDLLWMLMCGFLVMLMQAGFTCLESGMVRAKNSINVAIKNLVDFCISVILFALFGYGLMFGTSWGGFVGTDGFVLDTATTPYDMSFFFFEAVFCGTATTIVSGAVAERMRFSGYVITAVILSGLIYPFIGHWAWAYTKDGSPVGWLAQAGFIDFAGSTVVHSVGGWVALAAVILIGPRRGRFGKNGHFIEGNSLPMATLGVFLLWFGWFGFNGGSTLALTDKIPLIIINTTLAGAAGGMMAMAASWLIWGRPAADRVMNGTIAGLVAITAGCHLVGPVSSLAIGAVGGLLAVHGASWLERFKIDDAIGAVPVHLFAGIWGTLAVSIFTPSADLPGGMGHWQHFLIQLEGITVIGVYAFSVSFGLLYVIGRLMRLRVTPRHEIIGLNIAEHGATTSLLDLITQMDEQRSSGDFSRQVRVEPETEAEQIATFYNAVLDKFNLETSRRHMAMKKLAELANYDTLTGLANRRVFFDSVKRSMARAKRLQGVGAVLYLDLDGFKAVNDRLGHEVGDRVLKEAARRIATCVREGDLAARLGGDEFALLIDDAQSAAPAAAGLAEKLIAALAEPIDIDGQTARIGASVGIALFGTGVSVDTVKSVIAHADHAMYLAKLAGKGVYRIHTDEREDFTPLV